MARRSIRGLAAGAVTVLAAAGLTACAFGGSEECVDWPKLSTEQERTDASQLVVIGTIGDRSGSERMLGVEADAWSVTVDETLKGDATAGDTIRVVSTPATCSDTARDEPLESKTPLVLYLVGDGNGNWATVTPYDGTAPAV